MNNTAGFTELSNKVRNGGRERELRLEIVGKESGEGSIPSWWRWRRLCGNGGIGGGVEREAVIGSCNWRLCEGEAERDVRVTTKRDVRERRPPSSFPFIKPFFPTSRRDEIDGIRTNRAQWGNQLIGAVGCIERESGCGGAVAVEMVLRSGRGAARRWRPSDRHSNRWRAPSPLPLHHHSLPIVTVTIIEP
ncbi:hypothetical protein ACFE04_002453 [Oxalis oulophora]